ncbi:MAG: cytochrome P450, partial [Acidimicrobiales bacterium]|nr:cytochrome P450 [Acidimicrobiales bacterium]
MTEPVRYDPYDHAIALDPHPTWRRLRDEAPLYRNDEHDFWALSRFEDVVAASADWHTYSSARGTVLEMMDTRSIDIDGDEGYGQDILIFMDPPGHDVLRRLVSRAFTPRRVASLEDRIRELCARFLDELRDAETFDFVEDFGAKIPSMVIGELLGVPRADQDQLRIWGDAMMRYEPDGIS